MAMGAPSGTVVLLRLKRGFCAWRAALVMAVKEEDERLSEICTTASMGRVMRERADSVNSPGELAATASRTKPRFLQRASSASLRSTELASAGQKRVPMRL